MKTIDIISEEAKEQLFMVRVRGNFYGGKYYETGIDSLFVLANSPEDAVSIAKKNIKAVEEHFRNKRYANGKAAISKNDKKSFKAGDVVDAKPTKQQKHSKVLKRDGSVGPMALTEAVTAGGRVVDAILKDLLRVVREASKTDGIIDTQTIIEIIDKYDV